MAEAAPAAAPPAAGPAATPALQLERVAQRFGKSWVLRGCSLAVAPGEAVALLGSNGAGKTTLLRIAATLLSPTRGGGRVLGRDLRREAAAVREEVGLLGSSAALYEDLTAAENLRFACRMRGAPADEARIAHVLEEVGLAGRADVRVREFSSGMRRRVGLARLLLHPPRLLLLDEPYASFDADGIERVNALVARVKEAGGAVLIATHDLPRAVPVVERVLRLEDGVLLDVPHEPAPASRQTAAAFPPLSSVGRPEGARRPSELRRAAAVAWKDLTAERRTRANLNAVLFFAGLMLLLFGFALGPDAAALRAAGAGIVWLTVLYSGVLVFQRSYQLELEGGGLEVLLLSPGDRRSIFLGKLAANLALVLLVEAVVLPLSAALFHLPLGESFLGIVGILLLGTLGFVTLGTFYAALASRVRAREVLLPLLLFPMLVPLLVGAVEATDALLSRNAMGDAGSWARLLAAFDLIFLVASTLAFEYVIED
jgi:heme ABC exporter ATP-binding subunit CcmA/heme exporter protein CcmB